MRNDEKLNVIGPGDVLDIRDLSRKPVATPLTPKPAGGPLRMSGRRAAAPAAPSPAPTMHYALLAALTWVLGPFAVALTPAGRRRRGWLALGLVSGTAGVAVVVVPYDRFVPLTGLATPLAWGALATLAVIGGFSAWARAVLLAAAHVPPLHRLPRWCRSRPAVAALGLAAPGCGMLAGGGRWRAALWLWALWPAALGLLVLRSAPGMWRHLQSTLPDRAASDLLEGWLLLSAAAVALGALAWLVQALEGARRLAPAPALSRGRGDWFAVALGVACAALAAGGNPQLAARHLGDAALALQAEGLTVIPLQLAQAAARLDPADAAYAVTAIALHEERGDQARAQEARERLDRELAPYVALLGAPDGRAGGVAPAGSPRAVDPAGAGSPELYYGTLARARRPADR
jgi:hypothetical protein